MGVGCVGVPQQDVTEEKIEDSVSTPALPPIDGSFTLPVLLFHHIGEPPATASADARQWYVSEEMFATIVQFLQDNGYTAIFVSELLDQLEQGIIEEKSVILSFDDGAADFYTTAFPLLKTFHMKSVMHIMTSVKSDNWLTAENIKELDDTGLVEFGSHTKYHAYLTRGSLEEARVEMEDSKAYLEQLLGKPVYSIAYPFGVYNQEIQALAEELGYAVGMSLRGGAEQDTSELYELRRIIITNGTTIAEVLNSQ